MCFGTIGAKRKHALKIVSTSVNFWANKKAETKCFGFFEVGW